MIRGGTGGRTPQKHGLHFEKKTDFATLIAKLPGYTVDGDAILFQGKEIARLYQKYKLYSKLLKPLNVDYEKIISKKLLPDDAVLVLVNKTLYIVEKKFQQVEGSVDEKLQTCDFKLKQYKKLVEPLGLKVHFVYVLDRWFDQKKYNDTFDYIRSVGCDYFFEELPMGYLGLPVAHD